jgi:uncharacterized protein
MTEGPVAQWDERLRTKFPGASVDHDSAPYFRGLLEHRLLVNRCADCGTWHHPPRALCPACHSEAVAAEPVSGRGVVYLVTLLRQGPRAPGVDYASAPHPVVAVELDEQSGLRVTGTVTGCAPTEVRIGQRVRLSWLDRDGCPVLAFTPDREEGL